MSEPNADYVRLLEEFIVAVVRDETSDDIVDGLVRAEARDRLLAHIKVVPCGRRDADSVDVRTSPDELSLPTQDRAGSSAHIDGSGIVGAVPQTPPSPEVESAFASADEKIAKFK